MSTTWQYCAINDNLDKKVKKLKYFDAKGNHTVSEIIDTHVELAKLGNEGWELTFMQQIADPNARDYYLKNKLVRLYN